MKIDLDDTYAVEFDGLAFQLQKKRVVTGESKGREAKPENIGKIQISVEGFYGTLPQALNGYLKKDIGAAEAETFELVLDLLDAQDKRLDAVFSSVGEGIRELYKKSLAAEEAARAAEKAAVAKGDLSQPSKKG
jgi:hypothetical protein